MESEPIEEGGILAPGFSLTQVTRCYFLTQNLICRHSKRLLRLMSLDSYYPSTMIHLNAHQFSAIATLADTGSVACYGGGDCGGRTAMWTEDGEVMTHGALPLMCLL